MDTLHLLQTSWFFILGFVFIVYSLLDGFDLGIGSLLPFLSKGEEETEILIGSIGPFWDGNEVWLLLAGSALFAAFPHVYATVFSGFYLPMIFLIFGLIFRAVSIEFWSLDSSYRRLWSFAFTIGSLVPSLLFGMALGNVILGIPMNNNMDFTGDLLTFFRPFPVIIGLLGMTAIFAHGAVYAALKTEGNLRKKAETVAGRISLLYAAVFLLSLAAAACYLEESMQNIPAWVFALVSITSIFLIKLFSARRNPSAAFISSSIAFTGLWGIAGSLQFPDLVKGVPGISASLTIYNSSSNQLSLTVLLFAALAGISLIVVYTIYLYRIFRRNR